MEKYALIFCPLAHSFEQLRQVAERQPWLKIEKRDDHWIWFSNNLKLHLHPAFDLDQVKARTKKQFYDILLLDCRHLTQTLEKSANEIASIQRRGLDVFLEYLESEPDREQRYPLKSLAVLIGDVNYERVDDMLFGLGQRHVGACLQDRSLHEDLNDEEKQKAQDRLLEQLWKFCSSRLLEQKRGKTACCASGGGIPGIYYELGVLKCLNDVFGSIDVRDFDMFFGTNSGAFVFSFLANGFSIDSLIAHVGELRENWQYTLKLRWRHLNIKELPRRVDILRKALWNKAIDLTKGKLELGMPAEWYSFDLPFGPWMSNADIEKALRAQFIPPKHTNEFPKLPRQLFIGVTDQDRREHVLFGDQGYEDIPMSVAVQASTALHPFFPSVHVGGRYYSDGTVTRTSNLKAAIQKGATLVFVIDPFVPLISETAGYNAKHGNMWILQQDIKTYAFTRFDQVSKEVMRQNPQVACYTFVPGNRMRTLLTGNPLAAENFHPIVTEAYASTYRRLVQLEYKIAKELKIHGIDLNLHSAAKKVERMKRESKADVHCLLD